MKRPQTTSRILFVIANTVFLTIAALLCFLPLIHMLSVSLSSTFAVNANKVGLWPIELNVRAYLGAFSNMPFIRAYGVTILRVLLGTALQLILTFLLAFPLSRNSRTFPGRKVYLWVLIFSMLFSGGLVPTYMLISRMKLINSIWALILPSAVNQFFVILLMNFFREIPDALDDAAYVDGADHFTVLFRIYLQLSLPVIATLTLFAAVGHWNAWFDGIIFMNHSSKYPVQTYLQVLLENSKTGVVSLEEAKALAEHASKRSQYIAEMFLSMVPIILVYPYLQKYFTTGIVLGSVKG